MKCKTIGIPLLAALCSFSANSAEPQKYYAGMSVGQNKVDIDEIGFSGSDTAFKIFGGVHLSQYFDAEGTYIYGGSADDSIFGTNVKVETSAFQVAIIGNIPLNERISLFAKLGGVAGRAKASADGESITEHIIRAQQYRAERARLSLTVGYRVLIVPALTPVRVSPRTRARTVRSCCHVPPPTPALRALAWL